MRRFVLLILVGLMAGIALGYWWTSDREKAVAQEGLSAAESEWESERARLERELAAARNKPPQIQTVYREIPSTYTNRLSPAQLLDALIHLKPDEEETRNETFRRIIYYMQSLVDAGPYALGVIRDFLDQNVDVDYSNYDVNAAGERLSVGARTGFTTRNLARTDFLVPPSLRLGLFNVLKQVGGPEAEQMLAGMLATSARGVEIAYLTRTLHEMNPNAYRDMALQAAKDLLTNPPPLESPNRLDENAKAYLYEVLALYNDTSFAQTAQTLLVTEDGKVDQNALRYVNDSLKEFAVPAILAAYNDPRVSNAREKTSLLNVALNYTGPNDQANQIFLQMVTNQTIPAGVRAYSVQSLAGSSQHPAPIDPYVIKARLQFLETVKASLKEDRLVRAIDDAKQDLERILSGAP